MRRIHTQLMAVSAFGQERKRIEIGKEEQRDFFKKMI